MTKQETWRGLVEALRRTATRRGREQSGRFSIEGIRLHERALRAGMAPPRVLAGAGLAAAADARVQALLDGLRQAGSAIVVAPDAVLAGLTGGRGLGALLGLLPLPEGPTLAAVCAGVERPLLLVAADVVDPGNVGALLRTAHAGGATALVAVGVSDPYHPRAAQTSRGSLFRLPVVRAAGVAALQAELRALDVRGVGTAVVGGTPLPRVAFPNTGLAVFMGNEYEGLPPAALHGLDIRVTIPMTAGVDSYAVNAAAAVVLYEVGRQWEGLG